MFISLPAHAQLVGDDFSSGDSCASYPAGATTLVADADQDGGGVVLVCDGTNWQDMSTGGGGSGVSGAFNATGGSRNGSSWGTVTNLTEQVDVDSFWTGGTGRYQPTEAGEYFVFMEGYGYQCEERDTAALRILKNGSQTIARADTGHPNDYADFSERPMAALSVVNMNGTSDYIEFQTADLCFSDVRDIEVGGFKINGGSSGGSSDLVGLSDTTISGPANNECLVYNGSAWINTTCPGGASAAGADGQLQFNDGGSALGASANLFWDDTNSRLGINDGVPDVALDVVGDINYTGVIQDVSDQRLKSNITPLEAALDGVVSLNGYSFTMKDDDAGVVEYGLLAQEVEQVFPELVVTGGDGYKTMNYVGMVAPLIEAIKTQQRHIEALERRIERLEN